MSVSASKDLFGIESTANHLSAQKARQQESRGTTAHHESSPRGVQKELEMSNDSSTPKQDDRGENEVEPDIAEALRDVDPTPLFRGALEPLAPRTTNGARTDHIDGNSHIDKSDSEAETVVLSGKEEDLGHEDIKGVDLTEPTEMAMSVDRRSADSPDINSHKLDGRKDHDSRSSSLKRKRSMHEPPTDPHEGGNSSNLSSTISSPIQEAISSKASDRASDRSRSSPPLDDAEQHQDGKSTRQRPRVKARHSSHQEGRNDRDTDFMSTRRRRDTRSATHYDGVTHQSESPPPRIEIRGQSTQPSLPHPGVTKRKKLPAPLQVDRRRKASEEIHPESDDSSSIHSHHHLQRYTSVENSAMSPAKIVSHKKNRDRNGRTLLARACAQDAAEVERWLKERPQDLNVPDNAGNTPLQIAALEGDTEIVQLLLDAKCDINCSNIDKDTPLIDAVENGHLEVVKILLKAGLDPRIGNAMGREPIDLVPEDDEESEEIRAVLTASKKEKELLRRPSEDHNRQHNISSRDVEMAGTSPVNVARSPPPPALGARRRTARSHHTDDALLWVNATPARLRDAAGKGDLKIVDHILKMRPEADTESVLAAARGGHEVVLGLLLAIAKPDPDPEPLRSGDYKTGYNTPMLAAIGRGKTSILKLLLEQPGFDPTRRIFENLTYHDIAKERKGSEWEDEVEMLKEAYENHRANGGRKSNSNSPRKARTKRAESLRSSEPSSSPHEARKARKAAHLKKEGSPDQARHGFHREDRPIDDTSLNLPAKIKKRLTSASVSDQEQDSSAPSKSKSRDDRSSADTENLSVRGADRLKPKRRLMSGNERRASLAAEASLEHKRNFGDSILKEKKKQRRSSDVSETTAKLRLEEQSHSKSSPGKKRHRISVSPQASKTDLALTNEEFNKKKRQRIDSPGNAIDQDRDRTFRPGPAMVANMLPSPVAAPSPTIPQGTAPVAFMGSNVPSPVIRSPADLRPESVVVSPVNHMGQTVQRHGLDDMPGQKRVSDDMLCLQELDKVHEQQVAEVKEQRLAKLEDENDEQLQVDRHAMAHAEIEEAEKRARIVREEEDARIEAERQAEKQLQQERADEEARVAKRKRDEELQKQRKEQAEKRRREQEERENLRRIKEQENEERHRRASLPNGLRRSAELRPEEAKSAKEITKWLPLRTVTTQELDSNNYCDSALAEEKWVANIQVAPILAITDLGLSQCKSFRRVLRLECTNGINRHGLDSHLRQYQSSRFPMASTP